jgi:hypothetical protein
LTKVRHLSSSQSIWKIITGIIQRRLSENSGQGHRDDIWTGRSNSHIEFPDEGLRKTSRRMNEENSSKSSAMSSKIQTTYRRIWGGGQSIRRSWIDGWDKKIKKLNLLWLMLTRKFQVGIFQL